MNQTYQNPRPLHLLAGRDSEDFTQEIAKNLGVKMIERNIETFPNGEIGVEILESVRGDEIFIIQTFIPRKINDSIMELLFLADAVRRAGAERVYAVLRIFPYARQERRETNKRNRHKRRPVSARVIADIISMRFDGVIAFDLHQQAIEGFFSGILVENIIPFMLFSNYLKESKIIKNGYAENEGPVFVGPDVSSGKRISDYAHNFGLNYAIVDKDRVSGTDVKARGIVGEVKDRFCVVIDDITATGGTLITAKDALMAKGAKSVMAMVTHLEARTAADIEKLANAGFTKIVVTDSITLPPEVKLYPVFEVLTLTSLVGRVIENVYNSQSLQSVVFNDDADKDD